MSAPEVVWLPDVPAAVRALVEPLLAAVLWLVPPWYYRVVVSYDPNQDEDAPARVEGHAEYREAHLTFGPVFLCEAPDAQRRHVLHEVAHLTFEALRKLALHYASVACDGDEKGKPYALASEAIRAACEGATCDLTHAVETRVSSARAPRGLGLRAGRRTVTAAGAREAAKAAKEKRRRA